MKSLICKIIGHKLTKINKLDDFVVNYKCKICSQKYTTDGYGSITKLTPFWEENNLLFKKYYKENRFQNS